MNDKLIKLLISLITDEIDFNNKLKDLVTKRNEVIAEALESMGKTLKNES